MKRNVKCVVSTVLVASMAMSVASCSLFDKAGKLCTEVGDEFMQAALERDLLALLRGEEIEVPEYNFVTGIREYNGKKLQLWLTADKRLKAIVNDRVLESDTIIKATGFQRVALVLDNDSNTLSIYSKNLDDTLRNVTYNGYGPIIFGSTNEADASKRSFYKGRMLQGRVWNRAMNITELDTYAGQLLTGYELGTWLLSPTPQTWHRVLT